MSKPSITPLTDNGAAIDGCPSSSSSFIRKSMPIKEWAMLFLLSILWGGSFFFIGIAVTELPPLTIVALRLSLAAATLWLILLIRGDKIPTSLPLWRTFFVMGLLNNVIPFSLIVWGQTHIASGLASIINATTPLFTVLIAGTFLSDEKMTPQKIAGVIIGLFGVIVLIGPSSLSYFETNTVAQLAIVGAAISYGLASVYCRRFKTLGISPLTTTMCQVTAATLILLPVVIGMDQPNNFAAVSPRVWMAIFMLAIVSTALAYILYFRILSSSGATNVVLVTFLVPVTATLLGWLVLQEQLQVKHFIGMLFISLGLAAIDGRAWQKLRGATK